MSLRSCAGEVDRVSSGVFQLGARKETGEEGLIRFYGWVSSTKAG